MTVYVFLCVRNACCVYQYDTNLYRESFKYVIGYPAFNFHVRITPRTRSHVRTSQARHDLQRWYITWLWKLTPMGYRRLPPCFWTIMHKREWFFARVWSPFPLGSALSAPFSPLLSRVTVFPRYTMTTTTTTTIMLTMMVMVPCILVVFLRVHAWQRHAWQVYTWRSTFNLLLNPFTAEIFPSTVTVTFRNSHASHGREKFENIAAFHSGCCERRGDL